LSGLQEQRSKLDERMMAAVVSSIKAAEVIIAVVDSGRCKLLSIHDNHHCWPAIASPLSILQ